MRVLIVEDEPNMADAIRDGLRLEAIAADIAGDGDTALELLSTNSYDVAVLDRDIPRLRRQAPRDAVLLESALGVLSSPLLDRRTALLIPCAQTATRRHSTTHKDGRHRHPSRWRHGLGTSDSLDLPSRPGTPRTDGPTRGGCSGSNSLMDGIDR
jgi:DNA-binding NarL/FixJ family response regulator